MPAPAKAWLSVLAARAARFCFFGKTWPTRPLEGGRRGGIGAFRQLHILVNNAGTIARQGIADTTVNAWNRTLAVNLTGPMLGMKHCAPAIRDSGGGSIINISSTAGLTAHDDAAYTASKWGLRV